MGFTFFGNLIALYLLVLAVHECAHTITAYMLSKNFLTFHFELKKLFGIPCIPTFTWAMPDASPGVQCLIAEAGFVAEFVAGIVMVLADLTLGACLVALTAAHFACYPWYSTNGGDLYWLTRAKRV